MDNSIKCDNHTEKLKEHDERIEKVEKKTDNHEERIGTLEKMGEKAKKIGIYVIVFVVGGLIQHPENLVNLIKLIQELGAN